jgi:hypothetical protein
VIQQKLDEKCFIEEGGWKMLHPVLLKEYCNVGHLIEISIKSYLITSQLNL